MTAKNSFHSEQASTKIPPDYAERVYAGVLGKLIGVYLGRPFEQWSHEAIAKRWGEINRYVHEDQGVPLIVSDDDITGTFTFIRALVDHPSGAAIASREIGQTWLNYIAENRHILWWGGIGQSTEHTAFLRLKEGIEAPRSGSIELNGHAVAEEIGAQIFIDGWAMVSPNQPEQAARLAREAARVSHDGEAVYGAMMLAVMESLAFSETGIDALLDDGLAHIPGDCQIARMIADLRRWHREDGDWRVTLRRIQEQWGYRRYGTGCPVVSNHAIIILALLYGAGDFDRSMMIVNTAGYDTDCNSGNLGCLLGIRNGLDTFRSGTDWRTPVNDRLLLPAADGHRGVSDAARIAQELVNIGRQLAGMEPWLPKTGARYPFALPGATHGFAPSDLCPKAARMAPVEQGLLLTILAPDLRCDAEVATFLTPEEQKMGNYGTAATPTLYPGQTLRAKVSAPGTNRAPVRARLFARAYSGEETLDLHESLPTGLEPGGEADLEWVVSSPGPWPLARAGVSVEGTSGDGLVLEWLDWSGVPRIAFFRPAGAVDQWQRPSVISKMFLQAVDHFGGNPDMPFQIAHNRGRGIVHIGARDWRDYTVRARLRPTVGHAFGLAARVQGLTRFIALELVEGGIVRLVRWKHGPCTLAETVFPWAFREFFDFEIGVRGPAICARLNGVNLFQVTDPEALDAGGIGLTAETARFEAATLELFP